MFTKQELIGLRLVLDHAIETARTIETEESRRYVRSVSPLRDRVMEEEAMCPSDTTQPALKD